MEGTGIPVNQAVIFSIPILTNSASAPLSLGNTAKMRAQFALDFSSIERSKIWRQLCFDEPLLGHLCMGSVGETQKGCNGEHAETFSTKSKKLPFRQREE
jgi:hypothetical protein